MPEKFVAMTIHHLHGLSAPLANPSADQFFREYGFGLTADLLGFRVPPEEVEDVVNSGEVSVAQWPKKEALTDFYWQSEGPHIERLEELAQAAVAGCYGQTESDPIGGNFATVGAEMGSQQMALAGLIYAREQGQLHEITELGQPGSGPLYVAKGSFSEKMFQTVLPELFE